MKQLTVNFRSHN
jgi:hypothetical protein